MNSGRRLLVVDDDATIREMLELVLQSEGYEVTAVSHGAAALAVLDRLKPQAIVLDMKMPVMDGWEFLAHYRRRAGVRVPVVVVTAAQDDVRRAAEAGADAYVAKPFAIDDLIRALDRCMPTDGSIPSA